MGNDPTHIGPDGRTEVASSRFGSVAPNEDQIRKRAREIGKKTTGQSEGTTSSGTRPSRNHRSLKIPLRKFLTIFRHNW